MMRIMQFNVQDMFLNLAYDVNSNHISQLNENEWQQLGKTDVALKPLAKCVSIASIITTENPDIVSINEVGGPDSLATFAALFLKNRYRSFAARGNDRRGIDCGFLVKSEIAPHCHMISHADYPVPFTYPFEDDPEGYSVTALMASALDLEKPADRKFSRDVPELRILRPGEQNPALVMLAVHLKSGLDPDGIDRGGSVRRRAELKAALRLKENIAQEVGTDVPIILAGDFNMDLRESSLLAESQVLHSTTDLRDALAIAGRPHYERITHLSFHNRGVHPNQLDYIFIPSLLRHKVNSNLTRVYRYRFPDSSEEIQLPTSYLDRALMPSDHFPVICVLDDFLEDLVSTGNVTPAAEGS
jgi:exonuclease III